MLFMSKQVSLPKISLILKKLKSAQKAIQLCPFYSDESLQLKTNSGFQKLILQSNSIPCNWKLSPRIRLNIQLHLHLLY